MLRIKMINFALIWCCVFCVQFKSVVPTEWTFNDDAMVIEGHSVQSSDINNLLTDRNVSKIYVYLTGTFYVGEDLQLNGIREFQVFADIFNITMPVTIDLSGSDGAKIQETVVNGSAGNSGNDGEAGGNFFGLANGIMNGDYLTVRSNGGNGADGQDGAGSDDVYVLFSADDDYGESGWLSSGDLISYYKRYFEDRGYDAEISEISDHTSLYAVFLHNRMTKFSVRLHPKKCCGTTGIGGVGGFGGRSGNLVFNNVGSNKSQSSPRFVAYDGSFGRQGKDGRTCESLALDIRIDAKLNKVVLIFIFFPLHHSFSSHFTILNHTRSNCEPHYVTTIPSDSTEPNESEAVQTTILRYKIFLLKNMKNASHSAIAQETYKAIDQSSRLNYENSLRGLLSEALELEKMYFELKKSIDVTPLYERLLDRVERVMLNWENRANERPLARLRFILYFKLDDMRAVSENNFIVNLAQFTKILISRIELGLQLYSPVTNMNDVELQSNLNQLLFNVHGNSFLDQYHQAIDWFRIIYFPFAEDYLETYRLPASPLAYVNLNAIVSQTNSALHTLMEDIYYINTHNRVITTTDPQYALYKWNNADIRGEIRELFEGKKITLLADVRKSKESLNAFKFNTIHVVFRSPVQTVTDQLNNVLKAFKMNLNHTGRSAFRCNNNFYQIASKPTFIVSSFAKNQIEVPESRNDVYDTLRNNHPILSPYTLWELQLIGMDKNLPLSLELAQFKDLDVGMELHGTGEYILENAPICEIVNFGKFYTKMER